VIVAARSPSVRRAVALALVFGLALLAAGCGRRGRRTAQRRDRHADSGADGEFRSERSARTAKNAPITPPKTPFALDPIL